MKKINSIFAKNYPLNKSKDLCTIEIYLNQYEDIFNKYDSAPIERREINPELEIYLKRCCEEIPFKYSLKIEISVSEKINKTEYKNKLKAALKNYFNFQIYLLEKRLNRNNRKALFYIFSGFFLLWIVAIWQIEISRILLTIIEDGILIGGWVFLWEAVSLFFFNNSKLYKSCQDYKRLLNASLIFKEI